LEAIQHHHQDLIQQLNLENGDDILRNIKNGIQELRDMARAIWLAKNIFV